MLVARRFVIRGRVHGVGFRFFVEQAARQEGVSGWVRNLPEGTVETYVEGDAEAVSRIEQKIRRGPSRARVDRVEIEAEVPLGRSAGFLIV